MPDLKANARTSRTLLHGLQDDLGFGFLEDVQSSNLIKFMEQNFNFVLVSTYFDHGLCYLKQQLCWNFDDIVYLQQNQRSNKSTYTQDEEKKLYTIIGEIIPEYVQVFEYFEEKFRNDITNRSDIDADVQILLDKIQAKKAKCLESDKGTESNDDHRLIPKFQPIPISSYKLRDNSTDCFLLAMPESSLTQCLKAKQNGEKCP